MRIWGRQKKKGGQREPIAAYNGERRFHFWPIEWLFGEYLIFQRKMCRWVSWRRGGNEGKRTIARSGDVLCGEFEWSWVSVDSTPLRVFWWSHKFSSSTLLHAVGRRQVNFGSSQASGRRSEDAQISKLQMATSFRQKTLLKRVFWKEFFEKTLKGIWEGSAWMECHLKIAKLVPVCKGINLLTIWTLWPNNGRGRQL